MFWSMGNAFRFRAVLFSSMAAAALMSGPAHAQSGGEPFYKGKTINMAIGGGPGGGYDLYARFMIPHYQRAIPGNPRFVPQNHIGAGTLRAANFLYEVAAPDGTHIGTVGGGTATAEMFKTKGIRFDPRKYVWIGSLNSEVGLVLAYHTQPFDKFEDVLERPMIVGGGGPTSGNVIFPLVLNRVLGTKFQIVAGYGSTGEIALAIERGEVQGTGSYHYSSIISSKPEWIPKKEVKVLAQLALVKHPKFPDVPHVPELAKTDEQREVLELVFARQQMGRPFLAPPKTPDNVAKILRTSFNKMLEDKRFLADAEKRRIDLTLPMKGEEIHELIERLYKRPAQVVEKAIAASDTSAYRKKGKKKKKKGE
jgi:tripartite-type tricarboxylate transporter receptor subunit TctC